MTSVLKAAAYVRASPVERARQRSSASEQRRRLEEHIKERGWELVRVYEDHGPVDRPKDLPALNAVLDEAALLDRLVVVSLDRVAISVQRLNSVMKRLKDTGCDLVSLEEAFDTGEASGEAVPAIVAALAPGGSISGPRSGWSPERLRKHGFAPATLIDVGVAAGTPILYQAFGNAYPVLIEPLVEFEPRLKELVAEHGGEYRLTAVGAARGSLTLNLRPNPFMTSAFESVEPLPLTSQREVPVTTLDILFEERRWTTPIGLKIDVEGFEHAVIQGSERLLQETEFVIAEVSVTDRFVGECSSSDFIAAMRSHGFGVCDVIDTGSSSLGLHTDLLFKRRA